MSVLLRRYYQLLASEKRLTNYAQKHIIIAFGVTDGYAVINATNDYLNQLAMSDEDKAITLAMFIDKDPMLVCSLGIQPQGVNMPIRWLYNGGSSYFDTGCSGNQNTTMDILFKRYTNSGVTAICGHRDSLNTRCCWIHELGEFLQVGYGNVYKKIESVCNVGKAYRVYTEKGDSYRYTQVSIDDNATDNVSLPLNNFTNTSTETIYKRNDDNRIATIDFAYYTMLQDVNGNDHKFVPIKLNGVMELIDLETRTLAIRTGTFKESYTLQDGVTPWTPLIHNQTIEAHQLTHRSASTVQRKRID